MRAVRLGGVSAGLLVIGIALGMTLLGACGGRETPRAAPSPTPLGELAAERIELPRLEFCKLVQPRTIAAALDASGSKLPEGTEETSYGNGDEVELRPNHTQRLQELGCTWTLGSESVSAWIFARPVDESFARTIIDAARPQKRCRITGGGFGTVGLSQECPAANGATRVRHAGLFGQTWLTCQVTGVDDVSARAELWCSSLINELNTKG
jgi:hypothetical protein